MLVRTDKEPMSSYLTQQQRVQIEGADDIKLTTLVDNQQFYDPEGAAGKLGVCSASWPLFGLLWPSSIRLANKIAQRPVQEDERILEIGCGLALASLVAHRRGMNVTASDRHPMVHTFLKKNLKLNGLPPLRHKFAQWGDNQDALALDLGFDTLQSRFDLIMASDVLYERETPEQLAAFIDRYANYQAEVWIVDPNRGYAGAFTRSLSEYGFNQTKNRLLSNELMLNGLGITEKYSGRFLCYARGQA